MADHSAILNLMQGGSPYGASPLLRTGLSLLSAGYLTGIYTRNFLFNTGLSKTYQLPWPVVSIGNITTGGTGKTPFVLLAANHLLALGRTPCVLTRGYQPSPHSPQNFSDEATLLQQSLGARGHVQVNPNRHAGALLARAQNPAIDAFVMDDGFQHRKLYRNLDIVLVDASMHPGLWHALPRGLMREGASSLARASMVIITRADQVSPKFPSGLSQLDAWVQKHHGKPPAAHAIHTWQGYLDAHDQPLPPDALKSHNHVLALCALGNPDAFFAMAKTHATPTAEIHTIALPDHHTFDSYQSLKLKVLDPAQAKNACLLTTEKDWVKLKPLIPEGALDSLPPILRPKLTLQFLHGPDPLPQALKSIL
jgi:tetraacyldisaccharide 4'-kinase